MKCFDASALTEQNLREWMGDRVPQIGICVHKCIDSTNTEAKRLAADGIAGDVLIVAEEQTAGRGRLGRDFYSPARTGAYFSLLHTPAVPMDAAVTLTCAASVAVRRAIQALTGKQAGIKWVNDLYLDGKKICGILCESVTVNGIPRIVIGIGINIDTSFAGSALEEIAGAIGDSDLSPARLIAEVIAQLYPMLVSPTERAWLEEYREASTVLSRRVRFTKDGETHEGIALSIDREGALTVRTDEGREHRLFSGEITVRTQ